MCGAAGSCQQIAKKVMKEEVITESVVNLQIRVRSFTHTLTNVGQFYIILYHIVLPLKSTQTGP